MRERKDSSHLPIETPEPQQAAQPIDLSSLLWVLRKGWRYPLIGCLICLTAAIAYVISKPPLHSSSAQLLIDRSLSQYLTRNRILGQPNVDIGSQVYILKSDSVLIPVVRSLKLTDDPEFVGLGKGTDRKNGWRVSNLKKYVLDTLGWERKPKANLDIPRERIAVETLLKRLSVFRADIPTVINITVRSDDPEKAATIANTVAETYLTISRDAKTYSAKLAAGFLQKRLKDLKTQLGDAEKALKKFRSEHKLTATNTRAALSEQLSRLRDQLIQARTSMAVTKNRIKNAKLASAAGLVGILADDRSTLMGGLADNRVLTNFRIRRHDMIAQLRELRDRVGPSHPSVRKVQADIEDLNESIRREGRRIMEIYSHSHAAYQKRVAEIEEAIASTSKKLKAENAAKAELQELQAAVDSFAALYSNALQQYNQVPQVALGGDARLISRAIPSQEISRRKSWIIIGGAIVFGLGMGGSIPIGRDLFISPFRTTSQVRKELGVPCVTLPAVRKVPFWKFRQRRHYKIEEFVINFPYSQFANAIRQIEACVPAANDKKTPKVFCVSSCVPGEGKTTVLSNLATSLAAEPWGHRVLIIDCDLYRHRATMSLTPEATLGLLDALEKPSELSSFVIHKESSQVGVLACPTSQPATNSARILGSQAMADLLDVAREEYDYVLLEVPPLMSVVDVKMIERFIDRFVLVLEWGKTRRRLVNEVLRENPFLHDRLMCIVLNKADTAALKRIESYKGARYSDYYSDRA